MKIVQTILHFLSTVKKMVIPLGEKGGGEGEEQELQVFCLKNLNCIF